MASRRIEANWIAALFLMPEDVPARSREGTIQKGNVDTSRAPRRFAHGVLPWAQDGFSGAARRLHFWNPLHGCPHVPADGSGYLGAMLH
jgi:hypothetical protein